MNENDEEQAFTWCSVEAVNGVLDDLAQLPSDSPVMIGDDEPVENVTLAEAVDQLKRFRDGHRNNLFITSATNQARNVCQLAEFSFRRWEQRDGLLLR